MTKFFLILSLINSTFSNNYSRISSVEYTQTNDIKKNIIFNFDTDYMSTHEFLVNIAIYKSDGNLFGVFSNEIIVIGDKTATANIEYLHENGDYFLIDVSLGNVKLLEDVKFVMNKQDNCYLSKDNNDCKRIYKNEYSNGIYKENIVDIRVPENNFNRFLSSNSLDLNSLFLYSNYNFDNDNTYFILIDKVNGYDLFYKEGYLILLKLENNKFYLLEDYHVNVLDFKYSDKYFESSIKTDRIYFPYEKDYKEYNCKIIIESFVDIEIELTISTSEILFGECANSKFCIIGEAYD